MGDDGTTCIWAAQPAVLALVERGVDPSPVFQAARLSPALLGNVDARLPFRAVAELWDAAAVAAGDPFFGLHVAQTAPHGSLDGIEYLGAASRTLGEAYQRMARYFRLFFDVPSFRLVVEPRHVRFVHRSRCPAPQFGEFLFGYLVVRGRQMTAIDWRPDLVCFQHASRPGCGDLPSLFDCPVEFGARSAELRIPDEVLALPQRKADSRLLDILLRFADAQLAALPEGGDLAGHVASTIAQELASTLPTLASTVRRLGMHPRALQRRLAEKGLTYRVLLDEARRGLALKYIVDHGLSVSEIGYLLHFSDGTAFYRAFKRWTRQSPLEHRERAPFS